MTKKVSKIFLTSLLSLLLIIVLFAGYTQTGAFRTNLRSVLYEVVKTNLNASVYLGDINGNIVSGFTIDTVMVYVDNEPFIESGRISVRYDIVDLLRNRVSIDTVVLENPSVHLFRWKDGTWNVDHLSRSPSPSDSVPSSWVITAQHIRLANATFRLIDSTGDYNATTIIDNQKSVNYSNIDLTDIHLVLSGYYSSTRLNAVISALSFRSPSEGFTLDQLSMNFRYTKDSAVVSGLSLATQKTLLHCDANVAGVDLFSVKDLKEFENAPTTLTISSSSVASSDLYLFLPELYFLRGTVRLDGVFKGTFAQLNIQQLDASFAKSDLHLSGTISNLHQPKELRLNIVSKNSAVNPPDVPELLPYFGIPPFTQLGGLTMDFQFVGKPQDFVIISKIQSHAGTITVDGALVITEENLHYKGLLAGTDVNLEKIFGSEEFASRLNTRAYIEGSGTTLAQLNSEARIEIDSSQIRGIDVSSATLSLKAKEETVDADLSLRSPEGDISAVTLLDFRSAEPAYMLSTRVRNLNLAPILQDQYYVSRLSFDLNRNARSFDLFNGISNTNLTILPSTFRDNSIDSNTVSVRVDLDSAHSRRIVVQSPIANAELLGTYSFTGFIKTLQKGVDHIVRLYAYQRQVVDSGFTARYEEVIDSAAVIDTTTNNIVFKIELKNIRPISVFFHLPMIDVQGSLNGSLTGNEHKAGFAGDLNIQTGLFEQDSTLIQVRQAMLHFNLKDLDKNGTYRPLPIGVDLNLESSELAVNKTILTNARAKIIYDGDEGTFALSSDVDTTISVAVEGDIAIDTLREKLTFSRFFTSFQGFHIENSRPFTAILSREGFDIDSALLFHRDQTFLLDGTYSFNGMVNASATVKDFSLSDLYYFSLSPEFQNNALYIGGQMDVAATLTGSISDPVISVGMNGREVSYRETPLGSLTGTIGYRDKKAALAVEINNTEESKPFRTVGLSGVVPIDLRFISVESRTDIPGMDVRLTTTNLHMAALDPFIPELNDLHGSINGDIAITGTLNNPIFNGYAQLDSGSFNFEMTGIHYLADGRIELQGNKASFSNFIIRNIPEEFSPSGMNVSGYVVLKGFAPDEYHLTAQGELQVLQDRSRTPGSTFFGSLNASTGSDSIRFDGNYQRSRITGVILVQQASLTFPPTQQASSYSSSVYNNVDFVDDTSVTVIDTTSVQSLLEMAQQSLKILKRPERSFLDGFGYELTILTRGTVRVNMIFNANAGAYEELYAELNGKLTLSKDENGIQLKGAINVGNESKYTFYKTFNASGSLTFVGDVQNPQLNILATYEGTHCAATNTGTNDCTKEERVVVTLKISGSRNVPQVKLGLKTIDQTGKEIERTGDVENDAISFLLTSSAGTPGKFRDELTAQDRDRISEQLTSTIGGTYINSLLSSYMMDFITRNNIPYVKRVEVSNVYGDPNINVRVEVFDAVISAGGRVFSNINNTNFSVQRPILGKDTPNFMIEVEKKTENFNYSLGSRTILSARIYYRFLF